MFQGDSKPICRTTAIGVFGGMFQVGFLAWIYDVTPISNRIEMLRLSEGLVLPTPQTNLSFAEEPTNASHPPV